MTSPMWMIARHLLSIVLLPFTVTVIVPWWLAREVGGAWTRPVGAREVALVAAGGVLLAVGLGLLTWSVSRFAREGKGTLAPWDPPRQFVVTGPYRFVRNPMISGVILILLGESGLFRSGLHFSWALLFLAGNALVIPLVEEPVLRERFGQPYDEYCRNVGRLVPRLSPWRPDRSAGISKPSDL